MNESALFWKMILDIILKTQQKVEKKHDKVRIIINLAYNVTGLHKLDSQFKTKAVKP